MPRFQRAGKREVGLPLPLAFPYLILMILRACDLKLASDGQDFKLLHKVAEKNGLPNFKDLPF
jgi:hypothetical protein